MKKEFDNNELFGYKNSKKVIDHPETPSSYVEWREIIPIASTEEKKHIGNLLDWSYSNSKKPLGSSRNFFKKNFEGINEKTLDKWMYSLSETTIEDFLDFHLPFLRNYRELTKKWDSSKLVELYLNFYKDSSKGDRIDGYPEKIIVETTKSCNFSCVMCSSNGNGFKDELTMDLEDFGEVIRVFSPFCKTIRINGYGEASIIPNLKDYVGCLDKFNFDGKREIITNFSAPYSVYEYLAEEDFIILISWDAFEKGLFEKIRVGSEYERMLENLKKLGKKLTSKSERFILLATIQEKNIDQIVPLVDLASEVNAGVLIYNMVKEEDSEWMNKRFEEIKKEFSSASRKAKNDEIELKIPDHINGKNLNLPNVKRSAKTKCDRPFKEIQIRWDTELIICNMFNPYSLGVLFRPKIPRSKQNMKKRFKRLWNGPNARLFRSIVNTDKKHPYCENCYYIY